MGGRGSRVQCVFDFAERAFLCFLSVCRPASLLATSPGIAYISCICLKNMVHATIVAAAAAAPQSWLTSRFVTRAEQYRPGSSAGATTGVARHIVCSTRTRVHPCSSHNDGAITSAAGRPLELATAHAISQKSRLDRSVVPREYSRAADFGAQRWISRPSRQAS